MEKFIRERDGYFVFCCICFKVYKPLIVKVDVQCLTVFYSTALCMTHFSCLAGLTKCESQRVDFATNPLPGAFTPRCKPNGNFEAQQCHGSVCYCVNNHGTPIPGTDVKIGQGRPDCKDPGRH